jgi:serine/threonine protein kinase
MNWIEGTLLQSGKYKIIRPIGRGGFGLTYLAEDLILNRKVVIKTPQPGFNRDYDYQKAVEQFRVEGQRLARTIHANIVRVIEVAQELNVVFLVMEYVEGERLDEYIHSRGCLSNQDAVQFLQDLIGALHRIHQGDIIHCDISPKNIIINSLRYPVLIDFGSAKSLQTDSITVPTTVNNFYTPPEQYEGNIANPKWDVYALAATFYFAVTGYKPAPAAARKGL